VHAIQNTDTTRTGVETPVEIGFSSVPSQSISLKQFLSIDIREQVSRATIFAIADCLREIKHDL